MKTTSKLWALALAASVLSFSSCQEDEAITESSLTVADQIESVADSEGILIPSTATEYNEQDDIFSRKSNPEVDDFALLIASHLKDKEMRKFIKSEASKMFDGDYDILVSRILKTKIGKETFEQKVKSVNGRSTGNAAQAVNNPKLNISVPTQIDNWNDGTQQPLVAIAIGAVEGETKFLKAYDSNGKAYLLDAEVEPDVPVIVIGNNERMDMIEGIKKGSNDTNAKTSGRMQSINYLKCPNLKKIESWYFGGPEIRFDGVAYSAASGSAYQAFTVTRTPSRDQAKDGYSFTQDLFRWYFDDPNPSHGPNYYIQSWEIDDSGTTYKLGVSISAGVKVAGVAEIKRTTSFEISYKAQDKKLPGRLVDYRDPVTETISDDMLEFRMNERAI